MCNINAYSEAKIIFGEKDPEIMAQNGGGFYDQKTKKITLNYLGTPAEVDYPSGDIIHKGEWELTKNDKVLILQYLTNSSGIVPKGEWLAFIQLPGGPHHHNPFVLDAINPIAQQYGDKIDSFKTRASIFGATQINMGDYGVSIPVFPKLPMAVSIWEGDEEFPPNANILFDSRASLHLTTAALWVLGVELSRKLRNVDGQQFA